MFENKMDKKFGVYYSRWIASWVRKGGSLSMRDGESYYLRKWLEHMGLDEEDVRGICFLADNGKLELEEKARTFIRQLKKDEN